MSKRIFALYCLLYFIVLNAAMFAVIITMDFLFDFQLDFSWVKDGQLRCALFVVDIFFIFISFQFTDLENKLKNMKENQ